jgi:cell division protein FtsQ
VRRRHTLLAAGFLGALAFAASTGFGRHVRHVEAISEEIDRMLVASGFGINEISLTGHHHTPDQDVFRALGAGHATLLTLDVDAARRRVETLPWIETATLVRIFPDKLRVELRERKPSAIWHDGDRTALVDADGRLLEYVAPTRLPNGLPQIAGAGAPVAAGDLRKSLVRFPSIASRVRLASRIGDRRWDIELTNGTRVKLAAGDAAASLERLVRLERQTGSLDHVGQVVDLTVLRSIAISSPAPVRGIPRAPTRGDAPARPL